MKIINVILVICFSVYLCVFHWTMLSFQSKKKKSDMSLGQISGPETLRIIETRIGNN